jgi:hypothetical protein
VVAEVNWVAPAAAAAAAAAVVVVGQERAMAK